jgi:GNAT superfamily N-acetyltransferase
MASTEAAIAIETLGALTGATQAMLDELVLGSGWNQTAQDWAFFARAGTVFGVRNAQGRIVASGAVLPLGEQVAWISMILVAPETRGQGLGSAVFAHCLRAVRSAGRTAYLDATPAGQRIYSQFGFNALWPLTRWQRDGQGAAEAAAPGAQSADIESLVTLDAQALGTPRRALLADLLAREHSFCVHSPQGFALIRRGRIAHQIGPLLARDADSAGALLALALQSLPGKVFIDVPDERDLLCRQLRENGFAAQRGLVRMMAGAHPLRGQTDLIHAIAGPEFG